MSESRRWIVAGPPCAGKSTFVQQRAAPGDLVFDYDEVMAAISGRALHDHDAGLIEEVLQARAALIQELQRDLQEQGPPRAARRDRRGRRAADGDA